MKSTGQYVHHRILNEVSKDAYRDAMKLCIGFATSGEPDLFIVRDQIALVKYSFKDRYPKSIFNRRKQERLYNDLAVDQALDIFDKLNARFITGACDKEPRAYKNIDVVFGGDDNLF